MRCFLPEGLSGLYDFTVFNAPSADLYGADSAVYNGLDIF
jgi:hypothetical protein